jgi:hypothetical protein
MNARTRWRMSFALLLLASLSLSCNETEKANKLIESGNASVIEGNKSLAEAVSKSDKLFDSISPEEFPEERDSIKGLAQEAIESFEKSAEKFRDAAAKFDEASKLRISDKLKEYLQLKSQEFNKRAEQADVAKATPQAFMDSNDARDLKQRSDDSKDREAKLSKEAADLAEKSNRIQQENKDIFIPDSK